MSHNKPGLLSISRRSFLRGLGTVQSPYPRLNPCYPLQRDRWHRAETAPRRHPSGWCSCLCRTARTWRTGLPRGRGQRLRIAVDLGAARSRSEQDLLVLSGLTHATGRTAGPDGAWRPCPRVGYVSDRCPGQEDIWQGHPRWLFGRSDCSPTHRPPHAIDVAGIGLRDRPFVGQL